MVLFCLATAASVLLQACSGASAPQGNELLMTVPSDAVEIVCSEDCEQALSLALHGMDSPLRGLDFGPFRHSACVISFTYNADILPTLTLDTGDAGQDASHEISELEESSATLGLKTESTVAGGRHVMIIGSSEAVISEVRRHIESGSSIHDAPMFDEIFAKAGGRTAVFIRNSGFRHLISRDFMKEAAPFKDVVGFMGGFAEWTALIPCIGKEGGSFRIISVQDDSPSHFSNILSVMEDGKCRLPLPQGVTFAISSPVTEKFRECYSGYRDACGNLGKYGKMIDKYGKERGISPLDWESSLKIKEAGVIEWQGHRVVAVRPAKCKDTEPEGDNMFSGFPAVLYGKAFSCPDESFSASALGWMVFGSEEDVRAFCDLGRMEDNKDSGEWPEKAFKYAIMYPGWSLTASEKGMVMRMNN